jgi:hypothetical protein
LRGAITAASTGRAFPQKEKRLLWADRPERSSRLVQIGQDYIYTAGTLIGWTDFYGLGET